MRTGELSVNKCEKVYLFEKVGLT